MINEAAQQAVSQVQGHITKQPGYSINDYLTAKLQDPKNAAYYDGEILKLQKKELESTVATQLTQFQRKQQDEVRKQQADTWALSNYPQLKDPNSAMAQEVWRQFNSRPANKREPEDFAIAAELVANRMGIKPSSLVTSNASQDQLLKKERELRKLTKERAIEGDGKGPLFIS